MSDTPHALARAALFLQNRPGRVLHGKYVSLSVYSLGREGLPCYACIVSKKISTKATTRNLIKRRCRESVRVSLQKVNEPLAFVFRAKKETLNARFPALRDDIASLVEKFLGTR